MSAEFAHGILERLAAQGIRPGGVSADSRTVTKGDLFLAFPGFRSDGRSFIRDALARGAGAVLWEADGGEWPAKADVPNVAVAGLRDQVGFIADAIFGRPSEQLWVAGVTGTNGKTTVSQWIARSLGELDRLCGVIGTLGSGFPGHLQAGLHTTPDAVDVHRMLAEFVAAEATSAAAEVSSIGLDQGRTNGVRFDVAIHTNLTRDHLDYHGSMERYAAAKQLFFDLPGLPAAVVNADDDFGRRQAQRLIARGQRVIAYSRRAGAAIAGAEELCAEDLCQTAAGQRFVLRWEDRRIPMSPRSVGEFNVSNMLAVIGALIVRGIDVGEAAGVVGRMTAPEGRMQLLGGVAEPLVVIDYAHTPDALAQVLGATRATAGARHGRLICVFGCGGDRDPGKRPMMGEVAAGIADRVVITSDNPRGEDPWAIIDAIAAGAPLAERIVDRAEAIGNVLASASADDVVVLAGKGHEDYQEVKGVRRPFSDLEAATRGLEAWRRRGGAGA